ncbi:MAG: hypothetical protein JWQ34_71 [Mucilaginibacter sp.]|nr:hypothetical protein [Mucilaginibacter sp.]MDB5001846.1 hypothetical protein [Mucilaginibacter sp.]
MRQQLSRPDIYKQDIKEKYTVKIAGVDANGGIGDGSLKLNQAKKEAN